METVACILCGSTDGKSRVVPYTGECNAEAKDKTFTLITCPCEFIYLNPRPTRDEIKAYYPSEYYPPAELSSRTHVDRFFKRLSKVMKKGIREEFYGYPATSRSRVARLLRCIALYPEYWHLRFAGRDILPFKGQGRLLDVGCGPGRLLQELRGQGWEVYGVDFSSVAVSRAQSVGLNVKEGDLLTAGFESNFFDVVIFSHSLEHVYDPVATLQEARRVLKPGGWVLLYLPNAGSAEARLFGEWWVAWDPPRHLFHFDKRSSARLLEMAGFRVVKTKTSTSKSSFLGSADCYSQHVVKSQRKHGSFLRHVAGVGCLVLGHLGYGGELKVMAEKPS
jgi:SAM-dependent methyltransferase